MLACKHLCAVAEKGGYFRGTSAEHASSLQLHDNGCQAMILDALWHFVVWNKGNNQGQAGSAVVHRMQLTWCYTICRLHVTLLLLLRLLLRHLGYQRGACSYSLLLEICLLQHKIGFLLFYCSHSLLHISDKIETTLPLLQYCAVLSCICQDDCGNRLAITSRNLLSCLS